MKTITIEVPEGKDPVWRDGVLTFEVLPITEKIKTFEDACKWYSENSKGKLVQEYEDIDYYLHDTLTKDLLAYLKLRIITYALNEGWTPKFEDNERRYIMTGFTNGEEPNVSSAIQRLYRYQIPKDLYFKSRELAEYALKTFGNLYLDFCYKK